MKQIYSFLRRLWCRKFHNDLMMPFQSAATCRKCLEVWEVEI